MVKKRGNKIPWSGLAIASLVLGILALFPLLGIIPGIVGIILGIVALVKIKNTGVKGSGLAITGVILSLIGIVFFIWLISISYSTNESSQKDYPADADKFIGDTTYENTYYNFKFTYPNGSTFAHARPELGFVVRFFFPNGQKIAGDEENIGVYIKENSPGIEAELKSFNDSANGPTEIKEITLGSQKGYRLRFTSDYTASKGTQEMIYFTVKNNILYLLNYFPVVNNSIDVTDNVANSFEFTQ